MWGSALFGLLLVFDIEQITWPISQTEKWVSLVGTPRRWWCANERHRLTGRCYRRGPECHGRLPRRGPLWLGRSGKERHMVEGVALTEGPACCGGHRTYARIFLLDRSSTTLSPPQTLYETQMACATLCWLLSLRNQPCGMANKWLRSTLHSRKLWRGSNYGQVTWHLWAWVYQQVPWG